MRRAVVAFLTASSLVACSERDPVADAAGNAAAAEVEILPPDESVATPTTTEQGGVESPESSVAIIPESLRGRWGLTPGDCTSTRGDAKGLLVVSADSLRFYESVAKPADEIETSGMSIRGQFAFTGEGQSWKRYQALELQRGKLVRTESDPIASYTYARCMN